MTAAVLDRRAGLTAGLALLLMAVLAGLGDFGAVEAVVVPGDAARTAAGIADAETRFRLGVAALLVVVALDVLAAVALYRVFRVVHETGSQLSAALRVTYAAVFAVAIGQLPTAARLATDDRVRSSVGADQADAQVLVATDAFGDVWDAGLVLFGLHLLVLAWLVHRSQAAPRLLAPLLALAGVGYVVDSAAAVLTGDSSPVLSVGTFVGELALAVWLVVDARRRTPGAVPTDGSSRSAQGEPAGTFGVERAAGLVRVLPRPR